MRSGRPQLGGAATIVYIGQIMRSIWEGELLVQRRHIDLCRTQCALCIPRHA